MREGDSLSNFLVHPALRVSWWILVVLIGTIKSFRPAHIFHVELLTVFKSSKQFSMHQLVSEPNLILSELILLSFAIYSPSFVHWLFKHMKTSQLNTVPATRANLLKTTTAFW